MNKKPNPPARCSCGGELGVIHTYGLLEMGGAFHVVPCDIQMCKKCGKEHGTTFYPED